MIILKRQWRNDYSLKLGNGTGMAGVSGSVQIG